MSVAGERLGHDGAGHTGRPVSRERPGDGADLREIPDGADAGVTKGQLQVAAAALGPPMTGLPARVDRSFTCAIMITMYSLPVTSHSLGEFEQLVLLAIVHLRGEAYGIPIVEEIERRTGRSVARAAVYVTLRRLEDKGFVSSWMGDPTPERGGKGRRCVQLEAAGARALREARQVAERMWHGLDPASLRAR